MSLRSRTLVATALTLLTTLLVVAPQPSAEAATRPGVTSVRPASGPLKPGRVTITGSGFRKVRAVLFGGVKGTKVSVGSASTLTVVPPARTSPGTVSVQVVTAAGRSRLTRASTFRYLARPKVTSVSPASGSLAGGETVTVQGSGFAAGATVRFGSTPALSVRRLSSTTLEAVTPAMAPGPLHVRVRTGGGTSATSAADLYTAAVPAPVDRAVFQPAADTYLADPATVTLVKGGDPLAGTAVPQRRPWVVLLTAGASEPAVGQDFFLEPGHTVQPAGLAGRVAAVAVLADGTVRVDLDWVPVSEVLDDVDVEYSGPVDPTAVLGKPRRVSLSSTGSSTEADYGELDAGAFTCTSTLGGSVPFDGKVQLSFQDLEQHFDFDGGGLTSLPTVEYWLSYRKVLSVSWSGKVAVSCSLKEEWANRYSLTFLVGASGATVALQPKVEFGVSVDGTVTYSHTSWHLTGFATEGDGGAREIRQSADEGPELSASVSLGADALIGLDIRLGYLDAVGALIGVGIGASASVEVTAAQVCGAIKIFLQVTGSLFLDVFVTSWELKLITVDVELQTWEKCGSLIPETSQPVISTRSLPDAVIGDPYDVTLHTRDDDTGTWVLGIGSVLPAGLTLDGATGVLSGEPSGPTGPAAFAVMFVAADGGVAAVQLQIDVVDEASYAGGGEAGGVITRITDGGGHEDRFRPSISASGRFVVYTVLRNADLPPDHPSRAIAFEIWDRRTGSSTVVADDLNGGQARISADGRHVAYIADAGDGAGVYVWDRVSGRAVRIADVGDWSEPAISGDGRFVAYATVSGPDTSDIMLWDRVTGLTRTVAAGGANVQPSLSDDGSTVAYVVADPTAPADLNSRSAVHVWTRATGADLTITAGWGDDDPDVSADGSHVVFTSRPDAQIGTVVRVSVWDRAGGSVTDIPQPSTVQSYLPAISGDGGSVALLYADTTATQSGGLALWDVASGALTGVPVPSDLLWVPDISGDGRFTVTSGQGDATTNFLSDIYLFRRAP